MLSLAEHRRIVRSYLPEGAFLRIDRAKALFVSDAPRFKDAACIEIPGYKTENCGNLLRITPNFGEALAAVEDALIKILKADTAERDELIRKNLALALREHDAARTAFFKKLLEREEDR